MPLNPGATDAQALTATIYGYRVDRATAALPQTATGGLFTVKGGRVIVTGLVGEVTTIIQNQACNTKVVSTPTTGTATDLCAVLSVANDEVGCLYGITGVPADAMVGINAGSGPMCSRPVVIPVGTIGLNTAASNTGSVKWSIFYVPLDEGAYIEAA